MAALLVVWIHASELFAPLAGGSVLHDIAARYDFGRIGVVAFFGVSGLLIPILAPTGPTARASWSAASSAFSRLSGSQFRSAS